MTEIISAYHDRDAHDECGARIVELEAKLASAEKKAKQESDRWFTEFQNNQHLKSALKSLTAVIAQDALCQVKPNHHKPVPAIVLNQLPISYQTHLSRQ